MHSAGTAGTPFRRLVGVPPPQIGVPVVPVPPKRFEQFDTIIFMTGLIG